jgi:diguanylate cyclase (GGDEF)-like protein
MLTGLPNNRAFMNALSIELRRCKRYNLKCSILKLDLDDFKKVNEDHGDIVGDIVLREASIIIRNCIRDIDTAYRYRGGDFAIIFPETLRLGAHIVSERIRSSIEKHFRTREVNGTPLNLTVSGGIALFPEDGMTLEDLTKKAVEALYQAKAKGKNIINSYFQERRNFIRFDIMGEDFKVDVVEEGGEKRKDWESKWIPEPRNISKSGILLKSDKLFAIGQTLEISFVEDEKKEVFSLPGRVIRVEELEGEDSGKFEIGVAFIMEWENQEPKLLELIEKFSKSPRK